MSAYEGTDNLEVMKLAENYNCFLYDLVSEHASGHSRILDFGAGIGTFAAEMAARGFEVSCVELDAEQAQRIHALGLKVERDVNQLEDGSQSFIYTLNVLEHIEDDTRMMQTLGAKLEKGGEILVYLPAFNLLFSAMDEKVGHYRRYTKAMLANLAESAGLEVRQLRYADSVGFFVSLLYRYLGNDKGDINPGALKFFDRVLFPISRALDVVLSPFLGKNVYAVLRK